MVCFIVEPQSEPVIPTHPRICQPSCRGEIFGCSGRIVWHWSQLVANPLLRLGAVVEAVAVSDVLVGLAKDYGRRPLAVEPEDQLTAKTFPRVAPGAEESAEQPCAVAVVNN
nr:hypothetical protein [Lentzea sp. NBRC 105346]